MRRTPLETGFQQDESQKRPTQRHCNRDQLIPDQQSRQGGGGPGVGRRDPFAGNDATNAGPTGGQIQESDDERDREQALGDPARMNGSAAVQQVDEQDPQDGDGGGGGGVP